MIRTILKLAHVQWAPNSSYLDNPLIQKTRKNYNLEDWLPWKHASSCQRDSHRSGPIRSDEMTNGYRKRFRKSEGDAKNIQIILVEEISFKDQFQGKAGTRLDNTQPVVQLKRAKWIQRMTLQLNWRRASNLRLLVEFISVLKNNLLLLQPCS